MLGLLQCSRPQTSTSHKSYCDLCWMIFKICCIYLEAVRSVGCEADHNKPWDKWNDYRAVYYSGASFNTFFSAWLFSAQFNWWKNNLFYLFFIYVEFLVCCYISVIITQGCLLVSLCLETLKCLLFLSECNGFLHASICCHLFCPQKCCT